MKILINSALYNERFIQSITDLEKLGIAHKSECVGVAYDRLTEHFFYYITNQDGEVTYRKDTDSFDKALVAAKEALKQVSCMKVRMKKSPDNEMLEEMLIQIGDYITLLSEDVTMGEIKETNYSLVTAKKSPYDKLTMKDFLAFLKIKKLKELNIVDARTAEHLNYLLALKSKLWKKIGADLSEDDVSPDLLNRYAQIERELNQYHLLENDFDMESIILSSVLNKEYPSGNQKRFGEIKGTNQQH